MTNRSNEVSQTIRKSLESHTYLFFLHFQFSVFGSKFSLEDALHDFFMLVLQSSQLVIPFLGLLLPVDLLLDVLGLPIRVLNL